MSNPTYRLWFPAGVYEEMLECDIESLQARAMQIYDAHSKEDERYPNGYTTFNDGLDVKPAFADLRVRIEAAAIRFSDAIGVDLQTQNVVLADFWLNFNGKNCFHAAHNHSNSFISGAFYLKCPKNGGDFVLYDPKLAMRMYEPRFARSEPASCKTARYAPIENMLILFPSYLMHSVDVNRSDEMRISISFNFKFEEK